MKKIKEENAVAIKVLETEIVKLNEEIELTRRKVMDWNTEKDKLRSEIKCNLCEEIFEKFNDLEKHIEKTHDNPKTRRKVMNRNTERGKVRSEIKCNSCEEIFDKYNYL